MINNIFTLKKSDFHFEQKIILNCIKNTKVFENETIKLNDKGLGCSANHYNIYNRKVDIEPVYR